MASKYQRNAILIGGVDYYCLVCMEHIKVEREVAAHIETSEHEVNLATAKYVDEFKDELILKVKGGYFCVYCSTLMRTTTKVDLHVVDNTHINNKGTQLLRRDGNAIVAFNELLIEDRAWNGLTRDSCVLCQSEFDNEIVHLKDPIHSLNLIHCRVQFAVPHNIFRMVDDTSFHCITCNKVFAVSKINSHFEQEEHKELSIQCSNAYQVFTKQKKTDTVLNSDSINCENTQSPKYNILEWSHYDENAGIDNKTIIKILKETIEMLAQNDIKINTENDTAFCRKCSKTIDFNHKTIINHIKDHHSSGQKSNALNVLRPQGVNNKILAFEIKTNKSELNVDNSNKAIDIDQYAQLNGIDIKGNFAYCKICMVKLPATKRNLKEHVNETLHKTKCSLMARPKNVQKCTFDDFIEEVISAKSLVLDINDEIVNGKFCIEKHSFYLVRRSSSGDITCELCFDNLSHSYIERHIKSDDHRIRMLNTPIVISLKNEFVREVRSKVYHCGFCNTISVDWVELGSHLKSNKHRGMKKAADMRLAHHGGAIRARKAAIVNEHLMKTMAHLRILDFKL